MFGGNAYTVLNNAIDAEKYRYDCQIRNQVRDELKISKSDFVIGYFKFLSWLLLCECAILTLTPCFCAIFKGYALMQSKCECKYRTYDYQRSHQAH